MSVEAEAGGKRPGELVPTATNFYIHANNVSVILMFTDTEVSLQAKSPSEASLDFKIVPVGNIAMSPQLAKELAKTLATVVGDYEKTYGAIPVISAKK